MSIFFGPSPSLAGTDRYVGTPAISISVPKGLPSCLKPVKQQPLGAFAILTDQS